MVHADYLPRDYDDVLAGSPFSLAQPPITGVEQQFRSLRRRGDWIGVWDGGNIPPRRYTGDAFGQGSSEIHIQGVVRLRAGHRFLLSGGDLFENVSHLFLAETPSLDPLRPLGSNVRDLRLPPPDDRITKMFGLEEGLWHAGGIGLLGDVVAVPFQGGHPGSPPPKAGVGFYDFSEPRAPRRFPAAGWISCETHSSGAAALTRLPGGHLLAAVWRDKLGDTAESTGRLDFYVSTAADWPAFGDRYGHWSYATTLDPAEQDPRYQGIGFVNGGDEGLFLIGTANTSMAAPEFGVDYADLFRVILPPELRATPTDPRPPSATSITLEHLQHLRLDAADDWCDFAGGGGISISPEGLLCLYGAHHFRMEGLFRMTEFRADLPALPSRAYAWVDVYEHSDFRGRRLSILGEVDAAIADYGRIGVQGKPFENTASSVRYQLPPGRTYRLFRDRDFDPSGGVLDLVGTGGVEEIPDLNRLSPRFGDCVSSSRYA